MSVRYYVRVGNTDYTEIGRPEFARPTTLTVTNGTVVCFDADVKADAIAHIKMQQYFHGRPKQED